MLQAEASELAEDSLAVSVEDMVVDTVDVEAMEAALVVAGMAVEGMVAVEDTVEAVATAVRQVAAMVEAQQLLQLRLSHRTRSPTTRPLAPSQARSSTFAT